MTLIKGMQGTPKRQNPNMPGTDVPTRITVHLTDPGAIADSGESSKPRSVYFKKEDFEKHGYIAANCEGCRRLRAGGMIARPHAAACRKRMEAELQRESSTL